MPGQNYSEVAAKLRAAGLAGETPCAIISRATTPQQRTHRTTIAELAARAATRGPDAAGGRRGRALRRSGRCWRRNSDAGLSASGNRIAACCSRIPSVADFRTNQMRSHSRERPDPRHDDHIKSRSQTCSTAAESWTPQRALTWAFETFGNRVAISSAFGAEGMVLIDMASRVRKDFRLFTIDTEFLFPETYNLMDRIEEKYGITIEKVYSLLSPEEQERTHGAALWTRDPDHCCNLRKVEPLRRKLSELSAWITSIRRDQTSVRSSAQQS